MGSGLIAALLLIFILSLAEKVERLCRGTEAWHPILMASDFRRRHGRLLMRLGAMADCSVVVTLVLAPLVGAIVAVVVVIAYSIIALKTETFSMAREGCKCFGLWSFLDFRGLRPLLIRNSLIAGFAVTSILLGESIGETDVTSGIAGAGAVAIIGLIPRLRLASPHPTFLQEIGGISHAE